jgi:hypothetical protein
MEEFDSLAKGLAQGGMSRRKSLKLAAASIAGAAAGLLLSGRASAAPRTCVTCICGTGQPCNPKSTTCTEVRAFPANDECSAACARKNQNLCGLGQTFHCPQGCPA